MMKSTTYDPNFEVIARSPPGCGFRRKEEEGKGWLSYALQ